ncbi:hypothetical protein ACT3UD_05090 [Glutamicibacter sp. 287]|uniref:hypothetical protein n=1 Tax=unclassified Glutamicibacter TaxID=2627139 RepID=UPI001144E659|nr:hypothetical protein [Glutamicibacter sp. BW80]
MQRALRFDLAAAAAGEPEVPRISPIDRLVHLIAPDAMDTLEALLAIGENTWTGSPCRISRPPQLCFPPQTGRILVEVP